MTLHRLPLTLCLLYSAAAFAGPNWNAIDDSRAEKSAERQQQQQQVLQNKRLQTAFERLQAACNKVQHDDEVKAACKEMIEAASEISSSTGSAAQ